MTNEEVGSSPGCTLLTLPFSNRSQVITIEAPEPGKSDVIGTLSKISITSTQSFKSALKGLIQKGEILKTSLVDQEGRSLLMLLAAIRNVAAMQVMFWMGLWRHCIDYKMPDPTGQTDDAMDVVEFARYTVRSVKIRNELKVISDQEKSMTDLLLAARDGCSEEVSRLISGYDNSDQEGRLRARDAQGNSVLHHACASGDVPTLKLLIQHGCDLKAVNLQENNLLHATVLHGTPAVLKELLKHRAINVEEKNKADKTPAMLCAENGSVCMMKILTGAGATANPDLVGIAASAGCLPFVKHCIKNLKLCLDHVDSQKCTVLHHACSQGNIAMVQFVLELTGTEKKELLLARDELGRTCLHACCESALYSHNILKLLLRTAKDQGILERLIDYQEYFTGKHTCVLVCGRDKGRNAYHYVQSHRSTVAAFESSVGAGQVDVSQFGTVLKSGWGDYPSDNVVKQVDEMLINNAKKDPRVDSSALHLAVYKEKTECVKLLLEFGAAVNLRDCFGLTPLHLAAMRGNTSMVKMFEENGADFSIEDNQQQTPLDVARLNKHTITMDFIGQKCCVNTVQRVSEALTERIVALRQMDTQKTLKPEERTSVVETLRKIYKDVEGLISDLEHSTPEEGNRH
ncbi:hypothetical protein CAPTEDRAFT_229085 [Capitella teleta]|uniref:Uncharacterized protein n=1 Tax=Capitella teleta TaxID=283909 RepID=X2B1C6_CAPTE|nr:hypothetical protein CAPTEDRAFT_229085 [Capitella teleta]|eukprot:ELU00338.1 hypothetical protein CAPTEDRAFT_229085 [Capitella teleta]